MSAKDRPESARDRLERLKREFADRLIAEDHLGERITIEEVGDYMNQIVAEGDSPMHPPIARFVAGMARMVDERRSIKRAQLGTGYTQRLRADIAVCTTEIIPDQPSSLAEQQAKLAARPENYVGELFGVPCWVDPSLPPDALEFECYPARDGAA